ncbi:VOC family protein [Rhizobium azibense]|uniref:VOC family protein n=1 Tax=Rhizobium azibense TaxID=1136135 RepID=UPI00104D965E
METLPSDDYIREYLKRKRNLRHDPLVGLREVSKPAHLAASGGCWFEGEGVAEFVSARKAHPGLLVRDLSRLSERLEDAGFPTITDQPLDGYNRRYVSDPFGNRLELMERC